MPDAKRDYQSINPSCAGDDAGAARLKLGEPPAAGHQNVSFPFGMLCLAIIFDIIGVIPILNFITEALAGLIFGLWQKEYAPETDPVLTFIVAKTIDAGSAGILPSNIGIVVYAYIKKKAVPKASTSAA